MQIVPQKLGSFYFIFLLLGSFYLNDRAVGFHLQSQKFEQTTLHVLKAL